MSNLVLCGSSPREWQSPRTLRPCRALVIAGLLTLLTRTSAAVSERAPFGPPRPVATTAKASPAEATTANVSPSVGSSPMVLATAPSAAEVPGLFDDSYLIGVDDIVHIDVFDETQLSSDYTVSNDAGGSFVFPMIGTVTVKGLSVNQVRDRLTSLLAKDYLVDPKINVTIKEYRSKKVRILGTVGKPGIYYLDGPMRVFDLLSKAQDLSPNLGEIRRGQLLRIVRQPEAGGDGEVQKIQVDLYDLLVAGKEEVNIPLKNGDVIYISTGESVHVVGEVVRPGKFPFENGITVLKAITLAGGHTKSADTKNAVVKRIIDGKEVHIKSKLQEQLEPDDIVQVERSFW